MNFFTNDPNLICFWVCVWEGGGGAGRGGGGGGASVSELFLLRSCGGGGGGWMDSPTGPNQFASSTSSKLGT